MKTRLLILLFLSTPALAESCRLEIINPRSRTTENRTRSVDFKTCEKWADEVRKEFPLHRLRAWITNAVSGVAGGEKSVLVYDEKPTMLEQPLDEPDIRKVCIVSSDVNRRDRIFEDRVQRKMCVDRCQFYSPYTFEPRYCSWDTEVISEQPPKATTCRITVGGASPKTFNESLISCQSRCSATVRANLMTDTRCSMTDGLTTWEKVRSGRKGQCDRVDDSNEAVLDRKADLSVAECETFCRGRDSADPRASTRCRVQVFDIVPPYSLTESRMIYQNP